MGKLAARLLREADVGRLGVASRSQARAAEVAAAVRGRPLRGQRLPAALADTDILVTATGSAVPVVRAGQVRAARARPPAGRCSSSTWACPQRRARRGRLAGVTLADLTALARHPAGRAVPDQIPQVRAIVAAEAAAYIERQEQAAAAPVIAAMHAQIRQLADAELARLHDRLPELSEQGAGRDRGYRGTASCARSCTVRLSGPRSSPPARRTRLPRRAAAALRAEYG